jgi:hypothetical protein
MKNLIFQTSIYIHVLAGVLALGSGLVAMTLGKKGAKIHLVSGRVFYWSMALVFITTVIFFVIYPQQLKYHFFLSIGIISFYPTWSGRRMLEMKNNLIPEWYDKLAAFTVGFAGIVMVYYGIDLMFLKNYEGPFTYLFWIFGILSILNATGDLKYYLNFKKPQKMHWFFAHGGKMMGAYSAALTAFCVNIVPRYLPDSLPFFWYLFTWIAPGVLMAWCIVYTLKKYKKVMKIDLKS